MCQFIFIFSYLRATGRPEIRMKSGSGYDIPFNVLHEHSWYPDTELTYVWRKKKEKRGSRHFHMGIVRVCFQKYLSKIFGVRAGLTFFGY